MKTKIWEDWKVSDQSSGAFFARVNEDEIQRLKRLVEGLEADNAALKDQAARGEVEIKRLRAVLADIKDIAVSEHVVEVASQALEVAEYESGNFLALIRADLLEERARNLAESIPALLKGFQDQGELFNPDLAEGFQIALEDSANTMAQDALKIRASIAGKSQM